MHKRVGIEEGAWAARAVTGTHGQMEQAKGLSPVWDSSWPDRAVEVTNAWSQWPHLQGNRTECREGAWERGNLLTKTVQMDRGRPECPAV